MQVFHDQNSAAVKGIGMIDTEARLHLNKMNFRTSRDYSTHSECRGENINFAQITTGVPVSLFLLSVCLFVLNTVEGDVISRKMHFDTLLLSRMNSGTLCTDTDYMYSLMVRQCHSIGLGLVPVGPPKWNLRVINVLGRVDEIVLIGFEASGKLLL